MQGLRLGFENEGVEVCDKGVFRVAGFRSRALGCRMKMDGASLRRKPKQFESSRVCQNPSETPSPNLSLNPKPNNARQASITL